MGRQLIFSSKKFYLKKILLPLAKLNDTRGNAIFLVSFFSKQKEYNWYLCCYSSPRLGTVISRITVDLGAKIIFVKPAPNTEIIIHEFANAFN